MNSQSHYEYDYQTKRKIITSYEGQTVTAMAVDKIEVDLYQFSTKFDSRRLRVLARIRKEMGLLLLSEDRLSVSRAFALGYAR